jgi:FkbM family methyltransferase
MSILHELRRLLWKIGYDVSRFSPTSHPLARRKRLFECFGIDTVLDIGASWGKYAQELRRDIGYEGRILSFEPLSAAFRLLEQNAKRDPRWDVFNFALGDATGTGEINVAGNSYSSSLLDMLPSHLRAAPESRYVTKEVIQIRTVDSLVDDLCSAATSIYMKIDAQGYEERVIRGAERALASINTIQAEISLVPLYDGALSLTEMCTLMQQKGYTLVALEEAFSEFRTGQLLQVDGLFHRF